MHIYRVVGHFFISQNIDFINYSIQVPAYISPWYNCAGWLSIKHQLTYLHAYRYLYLFYVSSDGGSCPTTGQESKCTTLSLAGKCWSRHTFCPRTRPWNSSPCSRGTNLWGPLSTMMVCCLPLTVLECTVFSVLDLHWKVWIYVIIGKDFQQFCNLLFSQIYIWSVSNCVTVIFELWLFMLLFVIWPHFKITITAVSKQLLKCTSTVIVLWC